MKTLYKEDGIYVKTKYKALGQYEKETDSTGNVRELYYISGSDGVVAALQRMNEQDSIFYISKDNLGSFDVITNPDGSVRERYNYDPWGRRRNPTDWSYNNVPEEFFLDRGFTGHEHLDKFELINMNGRVYDQVMAMFLSPDDFVQSPDLTQNFNRYTYCLNNPLYYLDLSGNSYMKYIDRSFDNSPIWEPVRNLYTGRWSGWEPEEGSVIPSGDYLISWFSNPLAQSQFSSYAEFDMTVQKNGGYFWLPVSGYNVGADKELVESYGYYMPGSTFTTEMRIWVSTIELNTIRPAGEGGRFPLDERVNSYLEYPGRFGDPRDGGSRKHGGADLYAPVGTNVYAVKGGTVIQNPYKFYRGSYAIEINHGNFVARYSEINVTSGLIAGSIITQGQLIGTVADLSLNKSMLHFEMYSGDATGPLTNRANLPYMRRNDLIDPTHFLNYGY